MGHRCLRQCQRKHTIAIRTYSNLGLSVGCTVLLLLLLLLVWLASRKLAQPWVLALATELRDA